MTEEKKDDYTIEESAAPSGFDLAKMVSDMLADPAAFESCRKLGDAVLGKPGEPEPRPPRDDLKLFRLLHYYARLKSSGISFGDPLGCYGLMLFEEGLLKDIYNETLDIRSEPAEIDELGRLLTLASFGGITIMSEDWFDSICDSLRTIIEDLGGQVDL